MRVPGRWSYLSWAVLALLAIAINGCGFGPGNDVVCTPLTQVCTTTGGGGGGGGGGGTPLPPPPPPPLPSSFVGGSGSSTGAVSQTWNLTFNSDNTFSAQNVTSNLNYSGSTSTRPSGFLQTTTTTSNDTNVPTGTIGDSVLIPGNVAGTLTTAFLQLNNTGNANTVAPLVNTAGQCQLLSGPINLNLVHNFNGAGWDSTVSTAYETLTISGSGTTSSATYTISNHAHFLLDGTPNAADSGNNTATCSNGVVTVDASQASAKTAGFSQSAFAVGVPSSIQADGFIAMPVPANPVSISAVVSASYVGMIFFPNGGLAKVGFGPGAGNSISGGTFIDINNDPFSNHDIAVTINFNAQLSNGLLTGDMQDTNGIHTPVIAEVGTFGGKFVIFLLYTDTGSTTPAQIMLTQM